MIARLTGKVVAADLTHIILEVSGVGYRIAVREPSRFTIEQSVSLHTHLAVRENALDLYGFEHLDELDMFEELLRIPKIGPKSAMQILVQADIELLKKSVASNDPTYLSKMSGIGKKSAEKIVAGLKDTFEYNDGAGEGQGADADVLDALVALGYSQRDARSALQKLPSEITKTNERIREALKNLSS